MYYSDDDGMVDTESGEDNLYSDDPAEGDPGFAEEEMINKDSTSQLSYVVLKEEDIHQHQRTNIEQVSTVLSISKAEAIALLLHYQWNASKVEDEWFTDEERVRKLVGILKEPVVDLNHMNITCGICFETYLEKDIARVSCGHPYCMTCWTGYITSKITDGPGCLMVTCPDPSCSAMVGQDMIDKLISKEEDREKYYRYFLRSYVESSKNKIKWCPSPGCEFAVDLGLGIENYDVSCLCSYDFCWNCSEDAHRPVDCDTVAKWILKNNDESQNTTWILANTKPCPSCKRQIEKNHGCNHMMCSICKHVFCWACLGPLTDHTTCHNYKGPNETEVKRERAKQAIDRYMHYYERWVSNQSSRVMAIENLKKLQSVQLKKLSAEHKIPETELQFTVEAWLQIIECRRVLKWTYAYGYYLPEQESTKKRFFEYLQGEAEVGLERLHYCAELEFKQLVKEPEEFSQKFQDIRRKLIGLTKVTKTYFENLVKALENGLADVEHNGSKSATGSSKRQKLV